jgi:ribosomal protein S12 methylthiotransferase accessory factor YcaO
MTDRLPSPASRGDGQVAAAQRAYERLVDVPGRELFEFPIHGLDRLGVPVWTAMTWQGGPSRGGLGYGGTPEGARLSAWGEFAESVQPRRWLRAREPRVASYAELRREGAPAVDPLSLCLPVTTDYAPDRRLRWVEASFTRAASPRSSRSTS